MGLFTLCSNLKTKESYDRWVTRILREFRHQISKAKYPRRSQNVGCKYLEASGEHCSCATFCFQLGVIRVNAMEDPDMADRGSWNASFPIRICLPDEVEMPPFPSGSWIPDVIRGVDAAPDVSGSSRIPDVIHPDGNGGSQMEFLPGWKSYPDGISTLMEFLPGWKWDGCSCLEKAISSSFQLQFVHRLKHWILDFLRFERLQLLQKCSKSAKEDCNCCPLFSSLCFSSLRCSFLAYFERLWQRAMELQSLVLH